MTTFVTGANGHIGNTLVKQLLARGRRVRALVRPTSNISGLKDGSGSVMDGVEVAYGDVLDRESLRSALRGCDVVYHTAAVFRTRLADESIMTRTALEGTRHLLELCAGQPGIKKIIYTSSVAAVGCRRTPEAVLTERDWNDDPIDTYVASKLESERLAVELMKRHALPVVFVNPGTVLGPNDYTPTPSNWFILLAMQKMPPVFFDSGHSYTDVEDVAQGHLLAEERGRVGERYILAGENVTIQETFRRISRLTGTRAPWLKVGHRFVSVVGLGVEGAAKLTGRPPLFTRWKAHKLVDYYVYMSSEKAQRELGYRFRPFDEILQRCRAWYGQMGWLQKTELRVKN